MLFSYPSLSKRSLAVINPLPGVTSPIPIENPRLPKIEKQFVTSYLSERFQ